MLCKKTGSSAPIYNFLSLNEEMLKKTSLKNSAFNTDNYIALSGL
jgi:hypothetical protein